MTIRRGEIYLVQVDPTIGSEINKTRPALIIQNDVGNQYSPLTIVAPITSQGLRKVYPTEVLMASKESGLSKDSKVLLSQIRTIDKSRLIKKMGTLSSRKMNQVDQAIRISLDL